VPSPNSLLFCHYRPSAWLRVSGADAASWMQGQFTNDLRAIADEGIYGLWLNQKGKVLADSFVLRAAGESGFWIASYFCPAAAIKRRLEEYIVADDVVVEDCTDGWAGVALLGEGWRGAIGETMRGMIFRGRRSAAESWELIFPAESSPKIGEKLAGAAEIGADELELRRIADGIPSVPADIGPGDLPNEGGLEADAISYTKGCYLGQEVMSRLKSVGRVRRRLRCVRGNESMPARGAPLWQEGRRVGELRSIAAAQDGAGFLGMAMLISAGLREDAPLSLSAAGAPEINIIVSI
jgi:tRNA-modifying protein YgfZ